MAWKRCSIKSCHHHVDSLADDESQKVITVTAPAGYGVDRVENPRFGYSRWVRLVVTAVVAAVAIVSAVSAAAF